MGAHPVGVRPARGDGALDLVILDDAALARVDEEHLARGQPALLLDVLGLDVDDPELARAHHEPVVRHDDLPRPQAVAIQRPADLDTVREEHGGRPSQGSTRPA